MTVASSRFDAHRRRHVALDADDADRSAVRTVDARQDGLADELVVDQPPDQRPVGRPDRATSPVVSASARAPDALVPSPMMSESNRLSIGAPEGFLALIPYCRSAARVPDHHPPMQVGDGHRVGHDPGDLRQAGKDLQR